jgi:hypothetical protein
MSSSTMPVVEWRVCCEDLRRPAMGYRVRVYCRSTKPSQEPGPWRCVRDVEFVLPMGPLKSDYWKDLLRYAAK